MDFICLSSQYDFWQLRVGTTTHTLHICAVLELYKYSQNSDNLVFLYKSDDSFCHDDAVVGLVEVQQIPTIQYLSHNSETMWNSPYVFQTNSELDIYTLELVARNLQRNAITQCPDARKWRILLHTKPIYRCQTTNNIVRNKLNLPLNQLPFNLLSDSQTNKLKQTIRSGHSEIEFYLSKTNCTKEFFNIKFVISHPTNETILLTGVDISKLRECQNKYKLKDNEFRRFVDKSNSAILLLGTNGEILLASLNSYKILLISRLQRRSSSAFDFQIFDSQKNFQYWYDLAKSSNYTVETSIRRNDGTFFDARLSYNVHSKNQILVIFSDISNRKLQEQELAEYRMDLEDAVAERTLELDSMNKQLIETYTLLAENNTFLENIINNIPLGLEVFNSKGFSELTNLSIKNIIDPTNEDSDPINILTNPICRNSGLSEIAINCLSGKMTNAKEIGINYKEYQKYLRIFSFPIYDNMQNIRNVAIIFEDITEKKYMQNALKISEMQLSNFIEQSPNGNAILDSLGQILTQNQCMLNLFGEELAANQGDNYTEFIRKNIHRFSDTRFADKLQSFLLDTNATSLQVDTILDRDPQPAIDIVLSFFKIEVSQQFMIGCIAQDFTMRNNAEREIKRNLQRERELSEIKTAFVSMASHQFKTPMSTILSSVDLLANYISQVPDPLNTKMTKHTQRISGQILKLNEMINDFLMLGRIESGKIGKENGYFNLKIFLEQLIQEHFSTTENQPKLVFQTIEQSVFSDEKNLRHIFLNLISNAYKYSNGQAPEIRIHIANNLTVEVADKGIGIPQNEQQHIFGTFYRATNAETYKGTGLGLAIVKRLVETHLGTISFESSEGHGTTFHFEIPLSQS